jgi:hypothetical protein
MKKVLMMIAFLSLAAVSFLMATKAMAIEPGPGQVVFYDDYQCKNEPLMVLNKGNYPNFNEWHLTDHNSPTWNDRVSCFKIGEGTKLKIYQKINYGGKSKEFGRTGNNPNGMWSLSGDWWDNSVSSAKIY